MLGNPKSVVEPPIEPPLPLGNRSNGEYFHTQTDRERAIRGLALQKADELSRRHGVDRREFLASTAGVATTLWAINVISGCGDDSGAVGMGQGSGATTGGSYTTGTSGGGGASSGAGSTGGLDETGSGLDESTDTGLAEDCVPLPEDREFIFDVQTHHVNPDGAWRDTNPTYADFFAGLPYASCGLEALQCFSVDQYIEQMFLDSDTAVAVLSGLPATMCGGGQMTGCGNPITNDEIAQTREIVNALAYSERSVNHVMITPNVDLPLQMDLMQNMVESVGVGGWKCYPPWGPNGVGWWLDDPRTGIPFIEHGRSLGVKTFCIHKGLPLPGFDGTHTDPRDVGVVAAMFPDCNFIVYHSAWLHGGVGNGEGPYDPDGIYDPANPALYPVTQGVNSLIQAVADAGLGEGSNVYAELGSLWTNLMAYPDQAAHVLGKLMKHLGPNNIVWGTDAIWTGSPQPLIEAFRAFEISAAFQETYEYPALDDVAKRRIFGLNAAALFGIDPEATRCEVSTDPMGMAKRQLDAELGARRWVGRPAPGPRTRREFVRLASLQDGPG
ncbi:MAG: amidohydrolase family protein [Myxococcota bacterium]